MADTTKLAGTFKAWRLTLGVKPEDLDGAIAHCKELGLLPQVCGYQEKRVLFRVIVPSEVCWHPEQSFNIPHMAPFGSAIFHGIEIKLTCPVS